MTASAAWYPDNPIIEPWALSYRQDKPHGDATVVGVPKNQSVTAGRTLPPKQPLARLQAIFCLIPKGIHSAGAKVSSP